jgi:hypothetical protein
LAKKKKMALGWAVDGEKMPRWAAGGIDPPRPFWLARAVGACI